jgi:hypothetical protein
MASKAFENAVLRRAMSRDYLPWVKDWDPDAGKPGHAEREEYLPEFLEEAGISIHEDVNALYFDELQEETEDLLGTFPVVLFHHTASGALKGIRRHGLQPARQVGGPTNKYRQDLESPDYVFLTSEASGPAVHGYQNRAVRRFGGQPITLEVVVDSIHELTLDPDDEELGYSTQFIVHSVSPDKVL